ncbi:MAG: twin-arginine translocase TatA/TatE family subunit [Candidatus Omnitrophica bacterium CG11_big_fil_rev_8_21_14_0_20_63_9]|nr:MAG: twin-arginine translocase TatA/TatE family subunit [Candidatus Omnitrophica bacterium CG11_big_fil_rev_8_21_14_0_20_63_9]
MGNLGLSELLVIFVIALLVIGPRRLPEVARALGQATKAFQDALKGRRDSGDPPPPDDVA